MGRRLAQVEWPPHLATLSPTCGDMRVNKIERPAGISRFLRGRLRVCNIHTVSIAGFPVFLPTGPISDLRWSHWLDGLPARGLGWVLYEIGDNRSISTRVDSKSLLRVIWSALMPSGGLGRRKMRWFPGLTSGQGFGRPPAWPQRLRA